MKPLPKYMREYEIYQDRIEGIIDRLGKHPQAWQLLWAIVAILAEITHILLDIRQVVAEKAGE